MIFLLIFLFLSIFWQIHLMNRISLINSVSLLNIHLLINHLWIIHLLIIHLLIINYSSIHFIKVDNSFIYFISFQIFPSNCSLNFTILVFFSIDSITISFKSFLSFSYLSYHTFHMKDTKRDKHNHPYNWDCLHHKLRNRLQIWKWRNQQSWRSTLHTDYRLLLYRNMYLYYYILSLLLCKQFQW